MQSLEPEAKSLGRSSSFETSLIAFFPLPGPGYLSFRFAGKTAWNVGMIGEHDQETKRHLDLRGMNFQSFIWVDEKDSVSLVTLFSHLIIRKAWTSSVIIENMMISRQ